MRSSTVPNSILAVVKVKTDNKCKVPAFRNSVKEEGDESVYRRIKCRHG